VDENDHDQRFKTLIREFFSQFMQLFFAEWAAMLDCESVQWLEQEAFPDPPDGPRRAMDLVAELRLRQPLDGQSEPWLALVHIEIESPQAATPLRRRMYRYHGHLRDRYNLPVLPIGVFLKVGLDGIGIDGYSEAFGALPTVEFRYLYVGLPALDGLQYLESNNWLGVALSALMRIPKDRVAWLGAEALRQLLAATITERQRFLLAECVRAYLPMDDQQRQEYDQLLEAEPYAGVKAMNKTVYEQGIEKGIEKGLEKGLEKGMEKGMERGEAKARREILRELAADRFGPLSAEAIARIDSLPPERLPALVKSVYRAASLKDLGLVDS
jgi:hypothetical protein